MSPVLDHDDWSPPDEVEEYKLIRQIGRGTMGQVYLARDRMLDRLVAIKFITAIEPEARERFVVEARAAARIQHPNVVAVHRVGELNNRPYLITEFVRGQSLAELALPLPWARALELGVSLARGLAAAHGHGILHRDIKLANVVLSEAGEIKLLDFSLAKFVDAAHGRLRSATQPGAQPPALEAAPRPTAPATAVNRFADTITLGAPTQARPAADPAVGGRELLWSSGQAEITDVGALVGTPHYMAPELWAGEPASRASDVYALGVLLHCLCCGVPPTDATDILELATRVQWEDPPPLRERAPEVDRRFAEIIDRCLRRDPTARFSSGDDLREALEALAAAVRSQQVQGGNPYRGLQVFEAGQRELFFGRAAEIAAVVARVRAQNFVLVAGDSGVGKSSLCRAGAIPTACEGGLDPTCRWTSVVVTPGRRPVHTLVAAIARAREVDEEALQRASATPLAFAGALADARATHGTLLFVDQLEELITLASPTDAATAAEMLGVIARGVPRLRLIATVRGDFLTRVAPLPGLGDELLRGLYFLYPLSPAGVRQAIVGPAQARGVRFESEAMIQQLVTAGIEGSLPLLQFALSELWEARASDSSTIAVAALNKIGGVAGALARHAEGVLARLTPLQRRAARSLLLRLITIEETRASLNYDELAVDGDDARIALDALLDARLLLIRDLAEGPPVYEIAHEALIRGWVSLQVWLNEETESRQTYHRLEHAAGEWDRLGRPPHGLWSARQQDEARRIDPRNLRAHEAAFLAASAAFHHRARRLRLGLMFGAPLLIALGVVVALLILRAALQREVDDQLAASRQLIAEAQAIDREVEAHRTAAFAAFERGDEADGEAAWHLAVRAAPGVQLLLVRAASRLETAHGLDSARDDVRRALADVLVDQATLAERDHDPALVEALLLRVAVHDTDGTRMTRWRAPARVDLRSEPAGARVHAARYERDSEGRLHLGAAQDLGVTPLTGRELAPGSYLWTIAADGRAELRYPVLLHRGEHFSETLDLPTSDQIPAGYVYIPPGRFLVGSAADEDLRRSFFTATPLHESRGEGYLIAREETTYGDWLAFLESLPPDEQLRRSGRREGAVFLSAPLLTRDDDGWKIELRRGAAVQRAGFGQPIRIPKRKHHAEQDWLRWPITGINWDDAQAYLGWLSLTGAVPGARFCSEFEWERAARGADGRDFPTGDDIDPGEANYDERHARDPEAIGPEEIGSNPDIISPFGLHDTAGNVWEWASPIDGGAVKVVRGGSFYHGEVAARAVNRSRLDGSFADGTIGLRVCAPLHVRGSTAP
ncbi:MAG: SUMF1/EgtB/PvdO family nonheme iron enzyme [Nannocystis sp.]|uniref:nSTAND1 domain-containing NTPase n=1 Tax=Nannocystis sp. TaxID=1962667 RepID=UPI0024230BEC|nr:SUMF1/EgtB/PvdO family nonheme iron enzyme [Nannocystis sp.]MBK9757850.1 SUMF1/EgtB/PvdO family nonheme iron enzyme [Nannocystis sp.]